MDKSNRRRLSSENSVVCLDDSGSSDSPSYPKKRRDSDTIKYGFRITTDGKPQCVLCSAILCAESLKPSKMTRHLIGKHTNEKDETTDFFLAKLSVMEQIERGEIDSETLDENVKLLKASYLVALEIARQCKPHTIAETLVLPCTNHLVSTVVGEEAANQIKRVPLSNNSMARRIDEMADDFRHQIKENLKKSEFFAFQIDESTDVAGQAQLLAFVRYAASDCIEERMLFCKPLPGRTTGECIFNAVIEATDFFELDWKKCIAICSDGAAAMTGKNTGFITRLKELATEAKWYHCFIHRYALAAKRMPEDLLQVLKEAVLIVNFIKSRPLNSRLFATLCEEMGSSHRQLLLHTEVRWLSRGKVLSRLFELKNEVARFLRDQKSPLATFCENQAWLTKLAYLADIFSHLNDLNLKLQGEDKNMISLQCFIEAFMKKLDKWISTIESDGFEVFPALSEFIVMEKIEDLTNIKKYIIEHLNALKKQFKDYFPNFNSDGNAWVLSPFNQNAVKEASLPIHLTNELIDLSCDCMAKLDFKNVPIAEFWLTLKDEYANLTSQALRVLIPFPTSYLCELGFSSMAAMKTKYRNKLCVENDLLLRINSSMTPNIRKLVSSQQAHPSH